ncbi:hypothetical protein QAD02_017486 [Eretmocerus hayati]|uniref:Uncharacterized protein n=1 Tax=Eretmocerus hayati TaxID=131215 RepID=A0ACC2PGI0_9HYME|nr:hypothetical protein QAD02_017486 [Eretmocerus hayati]
MRADLGDLPLDLKQCIGIQEQRETLSRGFGANLRSGARGIDHPLGGTDGVPVTTPNSQCTTIGSRSSFCCWQVHKFRQTKSGGVLNEFQKGAKVAEARNTIVSSLGEDVVVQELQQTVVVDICDINLDTTKAKVALRSTMPCQSVKTNGLPSNPYRQRTKGPNWLLLCFLWLQRDPCYIKRI